MLVAEFSGNRIQKLSVTGEFLMEFGTQGSGNGQLSSPWGMCLSSNGQVYITEQNGRVKVYNLDGTFSNNIMGQGEGALQQPRAVAFDPSGKLHIAYYNSKHIKVFTADGRYIRQYESGHLQGPSGIAVDQDGYCLVGDWGGKSLCIFDPQGSFVHSVPTSTSSCGITLDKEGYVYVADCSTNSVYKF